jgi:hypothetical protein
MIINGAAVRFGLSQAQDQNGSANVRRMIVLFILGRTAMRALMIFWLRG